MTDIKISVIMATYNSKSVLPRALKSLWEQKFDNFEVLVADGGSTDGTVELLEQVTDPRLTWWVSEQDSGIYAAWNKALNHIKGDWVLFLGSDDELFDKSTLQVFKDLVGKQKRKYLIVYGMVNHVDENGFLLHVGGKPWNKTKDELFSRGSMMAHQGVFHSSRIFHNGHRFDEHFKICGDYDLLLRILRDEEGFFIEGFKVANMYSGGISSGFNNRKFLNEFLRARKINKCKYTPYIYFLQLRYFFRSVLIFLFGERYAKSINDKLMRFCKKTQTLS
jgi:glycosyltransferase involved in cell wall biosynthesis